MVSVQRLSVSYISPFHFAQVSTLFDNEGTVAFAMFMAVWGKLQYNLQYFHSVLVCSLNAEINLPFLSATVFLEFWKRHTASFVCEWKVSDWCEEEVGIKYNWCPISYIINWQEQLEYLILYLICIN